MHWNLMRLGNQRWDRVSGLVWVGELPWRFVVVFWGLESLRRGMTLVLVSPSFEHQLRQYLFKYFPLEMEPFAVLQVYIYEGEHEVINGIR